MPSTDPIYRPKTLFTPPHTSEIPGDSGPPLVGHTLKYMSRPIEMMNERYRQYGAVFRSRLFGHSIVSLLGPDANQFVLQDRNQHFSSKLGWDYFLGQLFTRGLMLRDFDEHKSHRRIMQVAFKKPALQAYLATMNPGIEQGLRDWSGAGKLPIYRRLKQLTLDLAAGVFLGLQLGDEAKQMNRAFTDLVNASLAYVRFPVPGLAFSKGLAGRRYMSEYFAERIPQKRASSDSDMFAQLCHARTEEGEAFSDQDIIDHLIFLMMAAHDTTTITLSNMFYYLAKNPAWQERLREEAMALDKPHLDYDDLARMEQAERAMKETLRMVPPVPTLPRKTVHDCEFKGFLLPKGTLINVLPIFSHHMPEYWQQPERFDPERFSAQRAEQKNHPYAWVPYGGGAHMCLGLHFAELQVKAILHQTLRQYRWSVPDSYRMPLTLVPLPHPKDGLPLKMERLH